jgi:hypothetical protein
MRRAMKEAHGPTREAGRGRKRDRTGKYAKATKRERGNNNEEMCRHLGGELNDQMKKKSKKMTTE